MLWRKEAYWLRADSQGSVIKLMHLYCSHSSFPLADENSAIWSTIFQNQWLIEVIFQAEIANICHFLFFQMQSFSPFMLDWVENGSRTKQASGFYRPNKGIVGHVKSTDAILPSLSKVACVRGSQLSIKGSKPSILISRPQCSVGLVYRKAETEIRVRQPTWV